MLDEIIARLQGMPEGARQAVVDETLAATRHLAFVPSSGPQTAAYFSPADVLLFGGSPGGGKSALEIGLALNEHHRSLIVRRRFSDLDGIIDTAKKLVGSGEGFVGGGRPKYSKPDGGVIHFAGLAADGGIGGHQGVDHDLICVDEAAQVPEAQVRLLMGWLRSDRPGQRKRVVLGSNPPLDSTGDWMIDFFGPWLNPSHPNPARAGELRWYLPSPDGGDRECGKDETATIGGVTVHAQSRTFIPSKFTDNPYYDPAEYAKTLAALPDQVREILVTGNFMLARQDDAWQTIPTAWIREAQARWTPQPPQGVPMCAMGVDVAQGGVDETILAPRHDGWFAPLVAEPGKNTPNGPSVAGLVISRRRDNATVIVDMGGGYGGSAFDHLKANLGPDAIRAWKGAEASSARTADRQLGFANKRSEAIWRFREALDPSQPGGSPIALPDDPMLVADLTAPRFEVGPRGIAIETKEKVCDRLGRSTDRGDSVVMSWMAGPKGFDAVKNHREQQSGTKRTPRVLLGHDAARRALGRH